MSYSPSLNISSTPSLSNAFYQTGIREFMRGLELPYPQSNRGYDPVHIIESFWLSIWTGANRYIHCDWLRSDVGHICRCSGIFLLGEVKTEHGYNSIRKFIYKVFILSVISGIVIFATSYILDLQFHTSFLNHPISIGAGIIATLAVPFIYKLIEEKKYGRCDL